jgi:hypothetical protein
MFSITPYLMVFFDMGEFIFVFTLLRAGLVHGRLGLGRADCNVFRVKIKNGVLSRKTNIGRRSGRPPPAAGE